MSDIDFKSPSNSQSKCKFLYLYQLYFLNYLPITSAEEEFSPFQIPARRLMQLSIKGKVSTAVRKLIDSARSYEIFNAKFAKPNQKIGPVQCLLIIDTGTFCHIAGFGKISY